MNYMIHTFISLAICVSSELDVPFSVANSAWKSELGNHRVRVYVSEKSNAVLAEIQWRRRDPNPENKAIMIFDSLTGEQIKNVFAFEISREYGKIVFQPISAPGEYYIYYMPYKANPIPWAYTTEYLTPQSTADQKWLNSISNIDNLPKAKVLEIQARTEFDRFDPMEVIATKAEIKSLVESHKDRSYLLFPEDRKYPIRMSDDLPLRWIRNGAKDEFIGEALRGEFYVFQIGVYSIKSDIEDLDIDFDKGTIPINGEFQFFNKNGFDWLGRPLHKTISIKSNKVGALWFGMQIPENAKPGEYYGNLIIKPKNLPETRVRISLKLDEKTIEDNGDNELWRLARLRWLNSTIGLDDEVTKPYTPLKINGKEVECLGRSVKFADNGLPDGIKSSSYEILARPITLNIKTGNDLISNDNSKITLSKETNGTVVWDSVCENEYFATICQSKMEFDGFVNFRISIRPKRNIDVKDIYLDIPINREIAVYMMGMGC
ncbi:MAG: glycoside hydrolase domain-containing protein, partial [Candidatus Poribacteria bacterium]